MSTQLKDKLASSILMDEIQNGLLGKNEGIPLNGRIGSNVQIRRAALYLLGGFAGSGKTTWADEMFVLQPFDYLKENRLIGKYKVIYWSMERPQVHKFAKWLSRRIYKEHGILIPFQKILGWYNKSNPLTMNELDYVHAEKEWLDELLETTVIFNTGRQNPTGIRKFIKQIALDHGREEKINEYNSIYHPDDPSKIWLNIFDHIGKLKGEQNKDRKTLLDDFSDDCSNYFRDYLGISSLYISQFNRGISNPMRIKNGDVEPMPEDFKETGDIYEDADMVFTIFDPWRYKVPDPSGFDLSRLKDLDGKKYYRNIKLMKNNYGIEDLRYGYAYEPISGIFKLLPKLKDMHPSIYDEVLNGNYYLNDAY